MASPPLPLASGGPVGFIGLGVMGAPMAACLQRRGWRLMVHSRRRASAEPLLQAGAAWAASPRDVAAGCRLVILSLPDAAAVEAVLFGDGGLAGALAPGSCVVDTSTIAPASARDFEARLRPQDAWWLDAPVSGGQQGAVAGTLGCMVGGDARPLEACRPVLEGFAKTITHAGGAGAGQAVKACNQAAVAAALLGVADALALARAEGLDPALVRQVLLGGTARSYSLETHGQRIVEGNVQPGFRARLMRKDLRLVLAEAQALGIAVPAAALAERLLDRLCESGRGELDVSALAQLAREG